MLGLTQASATEVLAGLFYVLGFRPEESVVVGLFAGGRVTAAARFDLDDAMATPGQVAATIERAAAGSGMASTVVVVASDDPRLCDLSLGEDVGAALAAVGLPCLDVIAVGRTTFATRHVGPLPLAELRSTRAAAQAVSRGRTITESRAALLGDVEPRDDEEPITTALGTPDATAVLTAWLGDLAGTRATPAAPEALLAALALPALRDAIITTVLASQMNDPQRLQDITEADVTALAQLPPLVDHVARATTLLAVLARRAESPGHVLAVLAWLAWWSGNGARAEQLAERALAALPRNRLAGLVRSLTGAQVPPPWRR